MTALPLVFDAPKRALPPRHLADLEPAERRAAVAAEPEQAPEKASAIEGDKTVFDRDLLSVLG